MLKDYSKKHSASERAREILRYIGPGLLITVGFIDLVTGHQIWQLVQILVIYCCGW